MTSKGVVDLPGMYFLGFSRYYKERTISIEPILPMASVSNATYLEEGLSFL